MGILSDVFKIGGSIVGGILGSSASKKAASAQEQLSREALALEKEMFQQQQALQEPFRQGGITAQNRLLELLGLGPRPAPNTMTSQGLEAYGLTPVNIPGIMGRQYGDTAYMMDTQGNYLPDFLPLGQQTQLYRDPQGNLVTDVDAYMVANPLPESRGATPAQSDYGKYARDFGMADFEADPGYAFRQSEGMKALERSAAARGGLMSGSTLKGIQRFGQDLASQEYQNAFNRYQVNRANQLNPLQAMMGSGQTSANVLTSASGQYGQTGANTLSDIGNVRASGYVGSSNALTNALSGIGNYFADKDTLNSILKSPSINLKMGS